MPFRYTDPAHRARAINAVLRLARLMDAAMFIPGTRVRVGLDPLLGLVPVAGDILAAAAGVYIVVEGARLGVRKRMLVVMLGTIAADLLISEVPVAGDIADIFFRSNRINAARVLSELRRQGYDVPTDLDADLAPPRKRVQNETTAREHRAAEQGT